MSDCVGSGYCCMTTPCGVAQQVYPEQARMGGRCPALRWDEKAGRYFCREAEKSDTVARVLFVGAGCSSGLNTWRRDVKDRPTIRYGERTDA